MRSINQLTPMAFVEGSFLLNCKKPWKTSVRLETADVRKVAEFAHEMTLGIGEHRDHRSGGTNRRTSIAIFHDTFNGKMCEVGVHQVITSLGPFRSQISDLDFSVSSLGHWDGGDIRIGQFVIQVKSTKSFGNLLLLEAADWNDRAEYLPGNSGTPLRTDAIVLARIKPALWETTSVAEFDGPFAQILEGLLRVDWDIDIVGFATKEDIQLAVSKRHLIPKNARFQHSVYMDADNYYIQAGDLWDISILKNYIRSRERDLP